MREINLHHPAIAAYGAEDTDLQRVWPQLGPLRTDDYLRKRGDEFTVLMPAAKFRGVRAMRDWITGC